MTKVVQVDRKKKPRQNEFMNSMGGRRPNSLVVLVTACN